MSSIGGVFGIDPIIDMGRTMLNVTGSMVSAIIVDKWDGTFNAQAFNAVDTEKPKKATTKEKNKKAKK